MTVEHRNDHPGLVEPRRPVPALIAGPAALVVPASRTGGLKLGQTSLLPVFLDSVHALASSRFPYTNITRCDIRQHDSAFANNAGRVGIPSMTLGERMVHYRKRKGWNQSELAERCGYEYQSRISMYERDEREPMLEEIERIAGALGVRPGELAFGDEAPARTVEQIAEAIAQLPEAELGRVAALTVDLMRRPRA